MNLIIMALLGLAAGAVAKMITPQQESGGWISSMIIGILGSMLGAAIISFLGMGALDNNLIGKFLVAIGGAVLVLFIYHRFLADKLNLKI